MEKIAKQYNKSFAAYGLLVAAALLLFLSVIIFCCWYLLSDYTRVSAWYVGLNSCFYGHLTWSKDFFTPGIKQDGNTYALIAIVISCAGLIFVPRAIRKWNAGETRPPASSFGASNVLPVSICLGVVIAAWLRGNHIACPAYDEVFSAENAAGIHPFQTISYYMLPNNHILFNLLNNLAFHGAADKVVTGRIISLVAYCILIVCLFRGFRALFSNRWLAALAAITLALQLPVWGFSFQARGYELYLLAEWGMVISLFSYLQTQRRRWLFVNVCSIVVGYLCLPSFLYLHVTQLVFMLLHRIFYKKKDLALWKSQLAAVLLTYLCYVPALCFSGLEVIVHNPYVIPMAGAKSTVDFTQWMFPFFNRYFTHLYSGAHWNSMSLNLLLLLVPSALLFTRKNRLFGMFYLAMWIIFFLTVIVMKRLPFERNLLGHYSITLAGVILFLYWASGLQSTQEKPRPAKWILFTAVVSLFLLHFISTNEATLPYALYEYDVNMLYLEQHNGLKVIPPGSKVAFSDGSFYCLYACRENGCKVSKCPNGNEDYYIMKPEEQLPAFFENKFNLVTSVGGYGIYKRR